MLVPALVALDLEVAQHKELDGEQRRVGQPLRLRADVEPHAAAQQLLAQDARNCASGSRNKLSISSLYKSWPRPSMKGMRGSCRPHGSEPAATGAVYIFAMMRIEAWFQPTRYGLTEAKLLSITSPAAIAHRPLVFSASTYLRTQNR